jgi:hypothetical protein
MKPINAEKNRNQIHFRTLWPNKRNNGFWHFSKMEKIIIGITISAILLVSAFGFIMNAEKPAPTEVVPVVNDPTASPSPSPDTIQATSPSPSTTRKPTQIPSTGAVPTIDAQINKPPGLIESSQHLNSTVWKAIAQNAWAYYQVGRGVDSTTGLPAAGYGWNYFTDWDLGVYIQAVMDAEQLGLITKTGEWGANARLEKVIRFLETRELNSTTKVPYWFYSSDGTGYLTQNSIDVIDTGTLFVALYNLKLYEPTFASRINNFVYNIYNNRTDYPGLVKSIQNAGSSSSIYTYYCARGFEYFWPSELKGIPEKILDNMYSRTVITYGNVSLPGGAALTCEPLLYSLFYLDTNQRIKNLVNSTYFAHEAYYQATEKFVAFSEGDSQYGFIWEWVVSPDGETWKISNGQTYIEINPIIYTKVSLSFLAIYNSTFAKNMSIYLEKVSPEPKNGYYQGADFNTDPSLATVLDKIGGNTNALILAAAKYALQS